MASALLIVQAVLALLFGMDGVTKLSQGKAKLADRMPWVNDFSDGTVRLLIGGLESLGAGGLRGGGPVR